MQKVISIAVYAFFGLYSTNNFANAAGPDYRSLDIQAPLDVTVSSEYVPTLPESFPIVTLPENCQSKFSRSNKTCVYAPEFDLALEQEYWRHVALQDTENMARWVRKKELYIARSQSPNEGRFAMLGIFAHLQIYSKDTKIFDLPNSPRVIKAFQSASKAKELLPRSPNTQAFYWAMRNFRDFALGLNNSGLRAAQHMMDLELTYGERGLAGPVGAVAHLMGSKDKSIVKQGIEEYDSCYDTGICNRDTVVAPYHSFRKFFNESKI